MIIVLQLTFLETWNLFDVRGMRELLIQLIQMFTYSKSYLKKHRTLNMSLVIANDGHWLGLERNEIKKTLANRRQGWEFSLLMLLNKAKKWHLCTIELYYLPSETIFLFAWRYVGLLYYNFCIMVLLKVLYYTFFGTGGWKIKTEVDRVPISVLWKLSPFYRQAL